MTTNSQGIWEAGRLVPLAVTDRAVITSLSCRAAIWLFACGHSHIRYAATTAFATASVCADDMHMRVNTARQHLQLALQMVPVQQNRMMQQQLVSHATA